MSAQPSRYATGPDEREPASRRWNISRLNPPNRLWGSNGIAFGPDGRLYVAQYLAGQISAVDVGTGDVDVVVPLDGPVQAPDDLAFGTDGSMYITDLTPGRVWRRDPGGGFALVQDGLQVPNGIACVGDRLFVNEVRQDGLLVELFPDGGEPVVLTDDLAFGNAMQLGPDGCLYYPHMRTGQVWRIPVDGGTPELVADGVHEPVAVRFDRGGVLTVLSRGVAGFVTRIDLATGSRTVVTTGVSGLDNAAFDEENRMYVSSFACGGVVEMHEDGRTREIVPHGFDGPYGITVDLGGTLYAADHFRLAGLAPADGKVVTRAYMGPLVHGVTAHDGLLHFTAQTGEVHTHDPVTEETRTRASGLDQPIGIAVAPDGSLLVAETGAGRVVRVDDADTVSVFASGLDQPTDVALDAQGDCYVSEERLGSVVRLADAGAVTVADGLDRPQGLAVRGDELFVVEVGLRQLRAVSLTTGESRVDAEDLAVGLPPGVVRAEPDPEISRFSRPREFAGLAVAPDGTLLVGANGEGSVWELRE